MQIANQEYREAAPRESTHFIKSHAEDSEKIGIRLNKDGSIDYMFPKPAPPSISVMLTLGTVNGVNIIMHKEKIIGIRFSDENAMRLLAESLGLSFNEASFSALKKQDISMR